MHTEWWHTGVAYLFLGVFVLKEDMKSWEKTGFREESIWCVESLHSLLQDNILVWFEMKLSKNILL